MIVEGINCARELLRAHYNIEKIIIEEGAKQKFQEIIDLASENNVKLEFVPKKNLEKICPSKHNQGIICYIKQYEYYSLEDVLNVSKEKGTEPFIILLDSIVDPHNVGSIIRTAECMGADGIVIPKNRACEINETVFKTSAGAVAHIKIAEVVNLSQTIEKLKKNNIWVYALEAGEQAITDVDFKTATALVVGSEGYGVSRLVKKTCDGTVSIPMFGNVNSLNASNAGSIAMYEVMRQRG